MTAQFDYKLPWQRRFDKWWSENQIRDDLKPLFEAAFLTAWTAGEIHALDKAAANVADLLNGRYRP